MRFPGNFRSAALVCIAALAACGRYGPPHPPEDLAPKAVTDVQVTPSAASVVISWKSPDKDVRGKELKSLEGYTLFRVSERDRDTEAPFEQSLKEAGSVEDANLEALKEARKEARERGEISRRVKTPDEKRKFTWEDKDVKEGETYLYRVVPINQGGEKGTPSSIIKVLFKGEQSDVFIAKDEEALDESVPLSPFETEEGQTGRPDVLNFGKR